jgi:hypothetical protein
MIKQLAQQMYVHVDSVQSDMRCCTTISHDHIIFWDKRRNHANNSPKVEGDVRA